MQLFKKFMNMDKNTLWHSQMLALHIFWKYFGLEIL